jgi:phytanoyl-CoA hydroxylase
MITRQKVEFYRENGYIMVENLADAQTLKRMRAVINDYVVKAAGIKDHDDIYDLEPGHTPERPRVRRIKKPHVIHPVFMEVLTSPAMMEVSRALLGSDIRLYGSKLNMKSPYYGSPVEWHQDWAFYPHTNDDVLAIGLLLEDCYEINGPLMVIPGSHKGPTHDHHADGVFCGAIDPTRCDIDFSTAVPLTGKAGSASFHHVRLVHGSAQNNSAYSRNLLLYELAAADAWPIVKAVTDLKEFNSRMLCGESTLHARTEADLQIRMPFPPAPQQGSIYENQMTTRNRYFDFKPDQGLVTAE